VDRKTQRAVTLKVADMPDNEEAFRRAILDKPTSGFSLTDAGNAKRLVFRHGFNLKYCFPFDSWFIWDEKRWIKDDIGAVYRMAKDTALDIYLEAKLADDEKERKKIAAHAIKSESDHSQRAMIRSAQSEPEIPILPNMLDADPWSFNCQNGTLNLRTGTLRPHKPKDLITKLSPVEYDLDAKCPLWLAFLNRIMGENQDIIKYLQLAVGYSLSGDTSEQCFFLLHGTGDNGKSTLLSVLTEMLGEYASVADFSTFLLSNHDGVRNDIARLMGVRLVSAVEAKGGRRLDEVLIKHLTGQDTVSARFLFHEYFQFKPTFKLWLAANHKPRIDGVDHAIWRRVRLIPFEVQIPEQEKDKHLAEKLKTELPGILAWAVIGCLEWQVSGLVTPDKVKEATTGYREESDILGGFFEDCCVIDQTAKQASSDLYTAYTEWCKRNSEEPIDSRWFGRQLSDRGFEATKSGSTRKRVGIRLKDPSEMV